MRRVLAAIVYVLVVALFLSCTALHCDVGLYFSRASPALQPSRSDLGNFGHPLVQTALQPLFCVLKGELPHQIRDQ